MDQRIERVRYNQRVLALSAAYAALLIFAEWLFRHRQPTGAIAYTVAILPALPIVGIILAIGRYLVAEGDEYLRMLMVRQTLIATGITLVVTTVWGFLESFGLALHLEAYFAAVFWFAGLGCGALINRMVP